jgi:DNA polymerase sigma
MKLNNLNYILINHLDKDKKGITNEKGERVELRDIIIGSLLRTHSDDVAKDRSIYALAVRIFEATNEVELSDEEVEMVRFYLHKMNQLVIMGSALDAFDRFLTTTLNS